MTKPDGVHEKRYITGTLNVSKCLIPGDWFIACNQSMLCYTGEARADETGYRTEDITTSCG